MLSTTSEQPRWFDSKVSNLQWIVNNIDYTSNSLPKREFKLQWLDALKERIDKFN